MLTSAEINIHKKIDLEKNPHSKETFIADT